MALTVFHQLEQGGVLPRYQGFRLGSEDAVIVAERGPSNQGRSLVGGNHTQAAPGRDLLVDDHGSGARPELCKASGPIAMPQCGKWPQCGWPGPLGSRQHSNLAHAWTCGWQIVVSTIF